MKAGAVLNKTEGGLPIQIPFRYLGEELSWPEKQNDQERRRGEGIRKGDQNLAFLLSEKGRHCCL